MPPDKGRSPDCLMEQLREVVDLPHIGRQSRKDARGAVSRRQHQHARGAVSRHRHRHARVPDRLHVRSAFPFQHRQEPHADVAEA